MDLPNLLSVLQCPMCAVSDLKVREASLVCAHCGAPYALDGEIPHLIPSTRNPMKAAMEDFWGRGWVKRGKEDASITSRERLLREFGAMELMQEIIGVEEMEMMRSLEFSGKHVLEIGCGVGSSSVMFALGGARVVAVDLTAAATEITAEKFKLLGLPGAVVRADAEHLPFRSSSFDIVFSTGVLHHTPDTEQAIHEIYRVLKPGGSAVVMLYAKWSLHYLIGLLLVRGILLGGIARWGRQAWLGHSTELAWSTAPVLKNPVTKVYTARQVHDLFRAFAVQNIRRHSFNWADMLPGIYRIIARRKVRIADSSLVVPSALEVAIGRLMGFSMAIHAQKPLV